MRLKSCAVCSHKSEMHFDCGACDCNSLFKFDSQYSEKENLFNEHSACSFCPDFWDCKKNRERCDRRIKQEENLQKIQESYRVMFERWH